jgi:hypothetical protein
LPTSSASPAACVVPHVTTWKQRLNAAREPLANVVTM